MGELYDELEVPFARVGNSVLWSVELMCSEIRSRYLASDPFISDPLVGLNRVRCASCVDGQAAHEVALHEVKLLVK